MYVKEAIAYAIASFLEISKSVYLERFSFLSNHFT